MTTLEARVASLEVSIVVLCDAIQQVATTQTLFGALATGQLRELLDSVKRLRGSLGDGDEWKDFG